MGKGSWGAHTQVRTEVPRGGTEAHCRQVRAGVKEGCAGLCAWARSGFPSAAKSPWAADSMTEHSLVVVFRSP